MWTDLTESEFDVVAAAGVGVLRVDNGRAGKAVRVGLMELVAMEEKQLWRCAPRHTPNREIAHANFVARRSILSPCPVRAVRVTSRW